MAITLTACTYSSCGKSFLPRSYYYPYRWNRWFLPVELPTNATAGELHRCISCNRVYCSRLTTWVEPWVIITFLHFFPRFYTVPLLVAGANFPLYAPQQPDFWVEIYFPIRRFNYTINSIQIRFVLSGNSYWFLWEMRYIVKTVSRNDWKIIIVDNYIFSIITIV